MLAVAFALGCAATGDVSRDSKFDPYLSALENRDYAPPAHIIKGPRIRLFGRGLGRHTRPERERSFMHRTLVLLALLAAALLSGCGSVINAPYTSTGRSFDFAIRAVRLPQPTGTVEVVPRVRWRRHWLRRRDAARGPLFSHAGSLITAQFGYVHFDRDRIDAGLRDLDLASCGDPHRPFPLRPFR